MKPALVGFWTRNKPPSKMAKPFWGRPSIAPANGSVNISISGVTMVSDSKVVDTLQTYDAGGGQILTRAQTAGTPLTLTSGSIQGAIAARDGGLKDLRTSLNSLAAGLISQI